MTARVAGVARGVEQQPPGALGLEGAGGSQGLEAAGAEVAGAPVFLRKREEVEKEKRAREE